MSQVIVILDSNTLTVSDWYFSDSPIVPVTPGIRLGVPEGLQWDEVTAVRDSETNEIILVQDPTRTAQAWRDFRSRRNTLLAASDWTQGNDSPLTPNAKQTWLEYRQALRDLPDSVTDPTKVEWPQVPAN